MRVNVLQHTPNEGPGAILEWAEAHRYPTYIYHPYQFGKLPTVEDTGMLVVLGGPMSPNDDFPWLEEERQLIKSCLAQHKPVFGVCLGAQQIAKALGAEVSSAAYKEVGWAPVVSRKHEGLDLPEKATVLHWHQDRFELPAGSSLLFSSDLLRNQGFIYQDEAIGLQFHLETTETGLREIVVNDSDYALTDNALEQTPYEIAAHGVPEQNRDLLWNLLDYLA
ncbi:type 1 glutamine amidotransferase [Lactobacillus corticis]|uniref:Glutamine amidotransferase n=1 Tax=Lactobacillus corticis TaxID=2201249 RepID=A0A916VHL6_9LACO|nr:type 1 glutamine amidotransferase [Lactobacillus corticis]GFZ26310.1 glutamine amidotransferase [Lactobacillus corticis]